MKKKKQQLRVKKKQGTSVFKSFHFQCEPDLRNKNKIEVWKELCIYKNLHVK